MNIDFYTKTDVDKMIDSLPNGYVFKGNCLFSELPKTATVNDTWYVTDKCCKYTWNGSAWFASSVDESGLEDRIDALDTEINNANELISHNSERIDATAIRPTINGNTINTIDGANISLQNFKVWSKNILNFPDGNVTVNGVTFNVVNGVITATGTATETVKTNDVLKCSLTGVFPVGTTITFSDNRSETNVQCNLMIKTNVGYQYYSNRTLTIDETMTSIVAYFQVSNGTTVQGIVKPQLEIGDIKTEYTPHIDTSSVDVTITGKNIIDLSKFLVNVKNCTANIIDNTISIVSSGDNCFIGVNAHQGLTTKLLSKERIIRSVGKGTYILQYKINGVPANNSTGGYWCGYYLDDGTFISSETSNDTKGLVFDIPENCVWICFNIMIKNSVSGQTYTISNLQLEKSDVTTSYEPYKSQTTTITSSGDEWETLHTYYGTSNVTNNLNAEMQLTYIADTKTYIDNKFNDLQNAILSSGANV